jgi:hypothetical protein
MKRTWLVRVTLVFSGIAVVVALVGAQTAPAKKAATTGSGIALPSDYRQWTHVKSMVIHDKAHPLFATFGGIHHVYANGKAADALKKKAATFPDGSILVFDLLDSPNQAGAYVEGKRKLTAVMVKDAKKYAETGGWGFEGFLEGNAGKRLVQDAKSQCFQCHSSQKNSDYVYSGWRP